MTYFIQRLNNNFPIYLIKNFEVPNDNLREELVSLVLECKKRNHHSKGGSFFVDEDLDIFFENLYNKFIDIAYDIFGEYVIIPNKNHNIWSYSSNKFNHGSIPGQIHNHINTSTINSVYYLNIPQSVTIEKGSISFFLKGNIFTYKPNNDDILIFPNYLDHRINNYEDDEEWRVSINMEINCKESSEQLFSRI
jgi:hypothetical protein